MKLIKCICQNCQKEFGREYSRLEYDKRIGQENHFCSRKCGAQFRHKHVRQTIDVKDVIHKYTVEYLGVKTIQKTYPFSQRTIENILRENGIVLRSKTWVLKNRPPFKNHKYTDEQKEIIRRKTLLAYEKDPTLKDKIRQKTLEQISNGKMPKSNTSIEKKMVEILTNLGIGFEYQKIFAFWCFDFYIPKYKLFIECDGDYWHGHPDKYPVKNLNSTQKNNISRGKAKETYVTKRGYRLVRIWESDINNNLALVKQKINDFLC